MSSPVGFLRALLSTWRGRFIAAFIVLQALLPLTYYVAREDKHDERYAWRMFSPMRMTRCRLAFSVGGTPVDLGSTFHEAWLEIASRGRAVVIEAMAHKLCRAHPGKPVDVRVDCQYFDRPAASFGGDLCTRPLL